MLHTFQAQVAAAFFVLVPLFAFWKGGPAERWTALLILLDAVVYTLVFDHVRTWDPQFRLLAVDSAELIGFIVLVLIYRRRWLVAEAGASLLCVVVRLIPLLDTGIHQRAWLTLETILGYIILLCLVVGTVQAMRARAAARAIP
jgi:hypothetical protein